MYILVKVFIDVAGISGMFDWHLLAYRKSRRLTHQNQGAESTVNKIPAGLIWFIIIVLSYMALNWRHPQFSDTFFGRQRRGSFRMGQLRSGFLAPRGGMIFRRFSSTTDVNIHQHAMISICHLQYFVLHMDHMVM